MDLLSLPGGEELSLLRSTRLAYWTLHDPGDESYRKELGLPALPKR